MTIKTMNHWRFSPRWGPNRALRDGLDALAWLVPNEDDMNALHEHGQNALYPWGEFSARHVERLRGFEGLLLVGVTCDDAGAWEARRRWRLLTEVLSVRQVQFRTVARESSPTLADHFAEGYTLDETRRVSLRDMREAIDREEEWRRVQTAPLLFERHAPIARTVAV